jgi:hypothetical protein
LSVFVTRPISAALVAAAFIALIAPLVLKRWRRHE